MRLRTKLLGIVCFLLLVSGTTLKFSHLGGAGMMLGIGFLIFIVGFAPSFLFDKLALESRRSAKISYSIFFTSSIVFMLAAMFGVLHLPGAGELEYAAMILFVSYVVFFNRPEEGRKLKLRKDRQLAAMLFTDIAGFTSMMGNDEDQTLQALDVNRKIQKKWIRKFRGSWLKEMGDGSISIFYTASEALLCAIEIQKEIQTHHEFGVRMGIHVGEILFTDEDAFGDGMNLASRICDQAEAGEICFSDIVHDNIRNRESLNITDLGPTSLKNVDRPIQLYRISNF